LLTFKGRRYCPDYTSFTLPDDREQEQTEAGYDKLGRGWIGTETDAKRAEKAAGAEQDGEAEE